MISSRGILKFAIPLLVVAAIIVFWRDPVFDAISAIATRAVSPFARGVRGVLPEQAATRPDELEAENMALRIEVTELRRALGFSEAATVPLIGARVVAYGRDALGEMLLLDRAGVTLVPGAIVVDADGRLVGTVVSSKQREAKVAIASNTGSSFEADVPASGARALLKGLGGRAFAIELIPAGIPVRTGDDVELAMAERRDFSVRAAQVVSVREDRNSAFQDIRGTLAARPEFLLRVFIVQGLVIAP